MAACGGGLQSHREHNEDTCTQRSTAEERDFKQAWTRWSQIGSGLRRTRGDTQEGDRQNKAKWYKVGTKTRSDGEQWPRTGREATWWSTYSVSHFISGDHLQNLLWIRHKGMLEAHVFNRPFCLSKTYVLWTAGLWWPYWTVVKDHTLYFNEHLQH